MGEWLILLWGHSDITFVENLYKYIGFCLNVRKHVCITNMLNENEKEGALVPQEIHLDSLTTQNAF